MVADPALLGRMSDLLVHRGPDGAGTYAQGDVGLAVRRLVVVDPLTGDQPLFNEDGQVVVVYNGEIYNHRELRRELESLGHRFSGGSDGAVLPHMYEEFGPDFAKRLNGMFAIALYDARDRSLHLIRDRMGIKPLYYTIVPEGIAFASEVKALLCVPGVTPEVDLTSLWHYLTFQYVPDPDTLFRGIQKVPPAHRLVWRDGAVRLSPYWELTFHPAEDRSLAQSVAAVRTTLEQAVRRHLMADVPRGLFLSGGLDSSALVALASRIEPVATFSVSFQGASPERHELSAARAVAQALGTRHYEMEITAQEYRDALPTIAWHQEDPVADPSAPGLFFLARLARPHVTVVLSGEGADELFGGYPIYREPAALAPVSQLPAPVRRFLARVARRLPPGLKGRGFLERATVPLEQRFIGGAKVFSEEAKMAIWPFDQPRPEATAFDRVAALYAATRGLDAPTRMQYVDCHTWLPGDILMKADKMTMAHSLELRVPFLDAELTELALTLPSRYKLAHGTTKYVLRQAVRDLLPAVTAARPKLGFPVPMATWLRRDLREFARDMVASREASAYLERSRVERLLDAHEAGTRDHAREIFAVLSFLLWQKTFLTGVPTARPRAAAAGEAAGR